MDAAIIDTCHIGNFRIGVFLDTWLTLARQFSTGNYVTLNVTLKTLSLGSQNATTGWYVETYTDSTVKMIIVTRASQQTALRLGTYVRTDALAITDEDLKEGDRVESEEGTLYMVTAVREIWSRGVFHYTEGDLEHLKLYKEA